MAGMWKRMAVYLGLAEDEYDDYDYDGEPNEDYPARESRDRSVARAAGRVRDDDDESNVRRLPPARARDTGNAEAGSLQAVPATTVHVTDLTTFNDVEEVGDRFRNGVPVIMNLGSANEAVAKRLLDFASGLIYGLDGRIERVGDRVFLLTPVGVEVSTEERRRLTERGFFNQA